METRKTRFIGLHVPVQVKEQLEQAAQEQTRSVSAQALHYIKVGLKSDGKVAE